MNLGERSGVTRTQPGGDRQIPLKNQPSNKEHMEVEIEHANLLFEAAQKHVSSKEDYDRAVSGAAKGVAIYRTWLGLMANEMERLR